MKRLSKQTHGNTDIVTGESKMIDRCSGVSTYWAFDVFKHLVFSPLCSSITLAKSSLLILCGFKGERKWLRIEEFVFPEKFRGKSKGFERRFRGTELWRKVQVFSGVFKEIVCLCTIYLLIRFLD